MAKRMEAAARIERWPIGSGEYDARRADRGADCAGNDDAHSCRAGGLIARTSNDGCANGKSGRFRALGRNFAAYIR